MMIFLTVFYIMAHLIGFGIGFCSDNKYPFLLPKNIYDEYNVNWFGAMFIYLVYLASTPLYAIGTFFWWLCTVGRK